MIEGMSVSRWICGSIADMFAFVANARQPIAVSGHHTTGVRLWQDGCGRVSAYLLAYRVRSLMECEVWLSTNHVSFPHFLVPAGWFWRVLWWFPRH